MTFIVYGFPYRFWIPKYYLFLYSRRRVRVACRYGNEPSTSSSLVLNLGHSSIHIQNSFALGNKWATISVPVTLYPKSSSYGSSKTIFCILKKESNLKKTWFKAMYQLDHVTKFL